MTKVCPDMTFRSSPEEVTGNHHQSCWIFQLIFTEARKVPLGNQNGSVQSVSAYHFDPKDGPVCKDATQTYRTSDKYDSDIAAALLRLYFPCACFSDPTDAERSWEARISWTLAMTDPITRFRTASFMAYLHLRVQRGFRQSETGTLEDESYSTYG
jgi:hypothetical protein